MPKKDSVFAAKDADVWAPVFGIPIAAGLLLLVFGHGEAVGLAATLIFAPIISVVLISLMEAAMD